MVGLAVVGSGCSIKRMAVNKVGDALAGSGTTFASDDDPELVKAAVPFSLKLMESLLSESPRHEGLLLATSSGFTEYAYAFVQEDADETEDKDLAAAEEMRGRARRYVSARAELWLARVGGPAQGFREGAAGRPEDRRCAWRR